MQLVSICFNTKLACQCWFVFWKNAAHCFGLLKPYIFLYEKRNNWKDFVFFLNVFRLHLQVDQRNRSMLCPTFAQRGSQQPEKPLSDLRSDCQQCWPQKRREWVCIQVRSQYGARVMWNNKRDFALGQCEQLLGETNGKPTKATNKILRLVFSLALKI